VESLDDLGHDAGADGLAAFTDGEAHLLFQSDGGDQLDLYRHVVARHHHLDAFGQHHRTRHVGRADVELRAVVGEERRVTAALFLLQDVNLAGELLVRLDAARLGQNLAALDAFFFNAAQQATHVVAGLAFVHLLAEHFHARADRLGQLVEADDLDFFVDLDLAALDTTSRHGAAALDREHVFDRHQERLVDLALRLRDLLVESGQQVADRLFPLRIALQRRQSRTADDRRVVAVELVLGEQLAHFHLDQVEHFAVFDRVTLVQEHDDLGQTDLTSQEHVLAGLRHHAVQSAHHQDRAVHLRGAGDHVLDVVRVARAIDVGVVTASRLVLHVAHRDRHGLRLVANDAALGDVGVLDLLGETLLRLHLHQRGRQRSLAVVDVTNRADVYVGFRSYELFLSHCFPTLFLLGW